MLILLSPAKNLDWSPPRADVARTAPAFAKDAAALAKIAKRLAAADLKRLMDLSDKLAELNRDRFARFDPKAPLEAGKQAALAFNGDVYLGLNAKSLSVEELLWAQDRLRILSGLYGLLRPLDAIQPYRLEMGVKLANPKGEDLYDYWGERLAKAIDAMKPGVVLNLASEEYASAVPRKALKTPMVSLAFRDVKDGKARSVFMFVKRARGAFARYAIQHRLSDPAELKDAVIDGYRFDPEGSNAAVWSFTRPQPPPVSAARD